jgi:hypothetical protein
MWKDRHGVVEVVKVQESAGRDSPAKRLDVIVSDRVMMYGNLGHRAL